MDNTQRDKIDEQLKQQAIAAQQHRPKTRERREALAKLFKAIEKSGMLCRPRRDEFLNVYEEIYTEARQDLMLRLCREIDRYNPEKEVMQWVNFLMNCCFADAIPKVIGRNNIKTFSLSDLDTLLDNLPDDRENEPPLAESLVEFIKEDPEGVLKNERLKEHPQVTFQILLLRIIADKTWKEISEEVGVKLPTIHSFYRRCLNKLKPKLRESL